MTTGCSPRASGLHADGEHRDEQRAQGHTRTVKSRQLAGFLRDDYNPVTMAKSEKVIPAGEFKARCLALLDEVAQTGKPLLVTKRGKPVARLVPVEAPPGLLHSVKKEKDLVSPIGEDWDAAT